MSLFVCLFLQLLFSAFWSDAQLTTSDQDPGEDCNSNLEYIRQSLQKIHQRLDQQKCSPNGQVNPCPAGFNYGVNAVNKCYAVITQPVDWDAAQEKCRALNPKAHLVVINSALENQIISEILNEHDCSGGSYGRNWFWISGRRQNSTTCSSPLVWKSNPRNNQVIGYTNWCPGEPDCGSQGQHCMTFAKGCFNNNNIIGWQDDQCPENYCPLCEVLRFEQP